MDRRQPRSIDQANAIAAEVSDRYNRTPQNAMGGVSPEQACVLIYGEWMDRSMELNHRLSVQDLVQVPLFQNARRLLGAVRELESVEATATGAFNRKLASRMFEEFDMPALERDVTARYNKVLNQDDVPYLELLRHLLPLAGLLLYRKGEFKVTKRANTLMADAAAGELFALLFRNLLLRINLSALDRLPAAPAVQNAIGFSLYQLGKRANEWVALNDLAPHLFLPTVLRLLPAGPHWQDTPVVYSRVRILRPLEHVGLVEFQKEDSWLSPNVLRKSSLFDQFIQFHLPPLAL
jgi:hypothetical protein